MPAAARASNSALQPLTNKNKRVVAIHDAALQAAVAAKEAEHDATMVMAQVESLEHEAEEREKHLAEITLRQHRYAHGKEWAAAIYYGGKGHFFAHFS